MVFRSELWKGSLEGLLCLLKEEEQIAWYGKSTVLKRSRHVPKCLLFRICAIDSGTYGELT